MNLKKYEWRAALPLGFLLLFAAVLYFPTAARRSIWLDEGFSLYDAEHLRNMGISLRPLYYVVLHFWMKAGTGVEWLRGLSILFALASIFCLYSIGKRLFSASAGLTAAALLVLSPGFIKQIQQIRMYSMGMFCDLAGTLSLVRALEAPSRKSLLAWVLFRLASFLTTPLNITGLAADIIILVMQFRRDPATLKRFLRWGLGAFALASPFTLLLAINAPVFLSDWVSSLPLPMPDSALKMIFLTNPVSSLDFVTRFVPWLPSRPLESFYVLLILGSCLLALVLKPVRRQTVWIALWAFLPPVILAVISYAYGGSLFVTRYLFFILPYTLLLMTDGFLKLLSRKRFAAYLAAFIYLTGITAGYIFYFRGIAYFGENWRGAAERISAAQEPNDIIIVPHENHPRYSAALRYYFKPENTLPVYEVGVEEDLAELKDLVNSLPENVSRLWLVYRQYPLDRPGMLKEMIRACRPRFPVRETFSIGQLRLVLLKTKRS